MYVYIFNIRTHTPIYCHIGPTVRYNCAFFHGASLCVSCLNAQHDSIIQTRDITHICQAGHDSFTRAP